MTYELLREGTGIQWPCTDQHPHGVERLYVDGRFNTDPDFCETYGFDIATGAPKTPTEYRALEPRGRAFLYGVEFEPGPETTDDEYPSLLTTGRTVYQFHTRTKTGRAPQLDAAAPDAWAEISVHDAASLAISEGDVVRVESKRGYVEVKARVTDIRPGVVFVPFHYGPWRSEHDTSTLRTPRAANELTLSAWDPVSKQPIFKVAAVRLSRVAAGDGSPAPAPTIGAPAPIDRSAVPPTVGGDSALVESTIDGKGV